MEEERWQRTNSRINADIPSGFRLSDVGFSSHDVIQHLRLQGDSDSLLDSVELAGISSEQDTVLKTSSDVML